jgi:hypothetical protein
MSDWKVANIMSEAKPHMHILRPSQPYHGCVIGSLICVATNSRDDPESLTTAYQSGAKLRGVRRELEGEARPTALEFVIATMYSNDFGV